MKELTKDDLKSNSKEELEAIQQREQALLNNGEVLLEAMLNVPFKNKEKFDKLKESIQVHNSNINLIKKTIEEINKPKTRDWSFLSSGSILCSNTVLSNWMTSTPSFTKMELTKIKYADNYNDIQEGEVLDDIFQSILGDYYMQSPSGSIIPLKRIIEIDLSSRTGKWYETMCKNFERETKLKRIVNDESETNKGDS
jgi:Txe/YoeB family toxin of Txe-Axe toxin-antitoxin module